MLFNNKFCLYHRLIQVCCHGLLCRTPLRHQVRIAVHHVIYRVIKEYHTRFGEVQFQYCAPYDMQIEEEI